eukprot:snap_masked-scaffold_17-processed-gene-5.29-mRNA-1 protein AED:1.00 eAED:1.00 QI:0/0/0/0/1/1/2/0/593
MSEVNEIELPSVDQNIVTPKRKKPYKPRSKRSAVHKYFSPHETKEEVHICNGCLTEVGGADGSTSQRIHHMRKCARLNIQNIDFNFEKKTEKIVQTVEKPKKGVFLDYLLSCNLPLNHLETKGFKKFLSNLGISYKKNEAKESEMREKLEQEYLKQKESIEYDLQKQSLVSYFSLQVDSFSSEIPKEYFSVRILYLDQMFKYKNILLTFTKKDTNLEEIIEESKIKTKILSITSDSKSENSFIFSNIKCLIKFPLYCLKEIFDIFNTQLLKVRNFIKYVKSSDLKISQWKISVRTSYSRDPSDSFLPPIDEDNNWSTSYWFIRDILDKKEIILSCQDGVFTKTSGFEEYKFLKNDFRVLENFERILKVFMQISFFSEKESICISQIRYMIESDLNLLNIIKSEFSNDEESRKIIEIINKLISYYKERSEEFEDSDLIKTLELLDKRNIQYFEIGDSEWKQNFELLIKAMKKISIQANEKKLETEVEGFLSFPSIKLEEDVFIWWRKNKLKLPNLFQLARALFSITPFSIPTFSRFQLPRKQQHVFDDDELAFKKLCLQNWKNLKSEPTRAKKQRTLEEKLKFPWKRIRNDVVS